jgi:perosamine synthetase
MKAVARERVDRRSLIGPRALVFAVFDSVHYIPNHLQPAFSRYRVPLPTTERVYEEMLTLPLFFEMSDAEVGTVIDAVRAFFR